MGMGPELTIGIIAVAGLIVGFIILLLTCYKTCEQDEALVRNGAGGPKVSIGGSMWQLPVLHRLTRVTLRTLKLDVKAGREYSAGIMRTKDMLPVNLDAEIYVRVPQKEEFVLNAARTLGEKADPKAYLTGSRGGRKRTAEAAQPDFEEWATAEIKKLTEQKLRSGIRSAIVEMTLDECLTNIAEFKDNVARVLEDDLRENGLELESVAIEKIDQEDLTHLTKVADDTGNIQDQTAARIIRERIEVEKTNRTQITEENQTKRNQLEKVESVNREQQDTTWAQETSRLRVDKETAKEEADRDVLNLIERTQAEEAKFAAETNLDMTKIVQMADMEAGKIRAGTRKDLDIFEAEAVKDTSVAEKQYEGEEQQVQLDVKRTVMTLNEQVEQAVEVAGQDRIREVGIKKADTVKQIGVSSQQADQTIAQEEVVTNERKAEAASAEEKIDSARKAEQMRRDLVVPKEAEEQEEIIEKRRKVVEAEGEKEKEVISAQADRDGAIAVAEGQKRSLVLEAEGTKESETLKAEAAEERLKFGRADAEATKLLAGAQVIQKEADILEGDNILPYYLAKNMPEVINAFPRVIEAAFKPLENIDGMKIHQVNLDGGDSGTGMGSLLKNFVQAVPAGGLLNDLLQMGGSDKKIGEYIENFVSDGVLNDSDKSKSSDDES